MSKQNAGVVCKCGFWAYLTNFDVNPNFLVQILTELQDFVNTTCRNILYR